MPDEIKPDDAAVAMPPAAVVAVVPEPAAAPAAAAPVEPVVPAEPAAAAAEAKPPLASERPSLLETFTKDAAAEVKPAEVPKPAEAANPPEGEKPAEIKPDTKPEAKSAEVAAEAKPAEIKPLEVVPFEPVKYEWELPEQLKADDARIGAFSDVLNSAKLPAEIGKETGQKLLGMHADAMQSFADQLVRDQHQVFNKTRDDWNKQVLADPEIGGAGHQTAMTAIARVRDALVSDHAPGSKEYAADLASYDEFLRITGAGDHPAHLRMMHRMARFIDEPQASAIPLGIRPPSTNGRAPKAMYSHPSSENMK